jgi:Domain of unknown function (DUF4390)
MPDQRRRELLARSAKLWLAAALASAGTGARGDTPTARARTAVDLDQLKLHRQEDGIFLSYDVRLELPADIEQALNKGVAVVFVIEAELFRSRWYWLDESRSKAVRRWRLAYQPLTRHWRLNTDGQSHRFDRLNEALDMIRRAGHWRIADPLAADDASDHYADFSFKLDTTELPRPLQIGLSGGGLEARLQVELRVGVPLPR